MDDHFGDHGIDPFIPPLESRSGFVFSNLKLGTEEVRVRLYGPRRDQTFEFYVAVPGLRADWHEVDWEALRAQETIDFDEEEALRKALGELPCCTSRNNGTG